MNRFVFIDNIFDVMCCIGDWIEDLSVFCEVFVFDDFDLGVVVDCVGIVFECFDLLYVYVY